MKAKTTNDTSASREVDEIITYFDNHYASGDYDKGIEEAKSAINSLVEKEVLAARIKELNSISLGDLSEVFSPYKSKSNNLAFRSGWSTKTSLLKRYIEDRIAALKSNKG